MVELQVSADKPLAARDVERAGLRIVQRDGVWYGDDGAQAIIDAHDSAAEARGEQIAAVKAEAQRRIFAIAPEWRQMNWHTAAAQLLAIRATREWTLTEALDYREIEEQWAGLARLREQSNTLEQTLTDLTDVWEILAVNVTDDAHWPEA